MPNRSDQPNIALLFDRDEWELLVTLPGRVLVAALAEAPEGGRRAAEGIAGIEAIAAGLASPSQLVRQVVQSIYTEAHGEPARALSGAGGTGEGRESGVQTLAACRYASEVLSARCEPADVDGYRDWLRHIAAVVTGVAAASGGPGPELGAPTRRVGLAESRFLYALGGVLRP